MALFLYNMFIGLYGLLIRIVSPLNNKAALFVKGRKGLLEQVKQAMNTNKRPVAWFHAASLGEFEQGLPVIEAYKERYPNYFIYITFFSPSGYEQCKDYKGADLITYLPLDRPTQVNKLLSLVKPSIMVFVKYEFWYHFLHQANGMNIPLYCISATFTPDHIFFKAHGGLHRRMLHFFDHIFVQTEQSKSLLNGIDIEKVSLSGDTRFDRVVSTLENPKGYPVVEAFKARKDLVIIGSSWPEDMELLYPLINQEYSNLKFIIAPHDVSEASVARLEKGLEQPFVRITNATEGNVEKNNILIINTIGMLSNIYQYGSFAYIGGAFGDGLHNILEAVTFGLPVVFGNKGLEKFPESLELAAKGGAFPINDALGLQSIFKKLYDGSGFRDNASAICNRYIEEKTGATAFVLNYWKEHYEG